MPESHDRPGKSYPRRTVLLWGGAAGALLPVIARTGAADASPPSKTSSAEKRWWDMWPRFNNSSNAGNAVDTDSTVLTAFLQDEGRGAFFREATFHDPANVAALKTLADHGIRYIPWLEGMGTTRATIGAVDRRADGTYLVDSATGNPKLIATNWSWDLAGPGRDSRANTIVWMGVFSWANQEEWQGAATRPDSFPVPTYPDGTPALGYVDDDSSDPRKARLIDAMCGRDLNGELRVEYYPLPAAPGHTKNTAGELAVTEPDGSVQYVGDLDVAKDLACPWWVLYNNAAAKYFIGRGAGGFWIDNYNGWDFIGNSPVGKAFGHWSVAGFTDHMRLRGKRDVDVRAELKATFRKWFPDGDPDDLSTAGWSDERWLTDPTWIEFKLYKSDVVARRMREGYEGIKLAARDAGKDPDTIYVGGNDIGKLNTGAEAGTGQLDQVNIEYDPYNSPVTGPYSDKIPPYGQAGPYYRHVQQYAESQHTAIWYYLQAAPVSAFQNDPTLGEFLGYEALTNNVVLNDGADNNSDPGNSASALAVNQTIDRLAPVFGARDQYADVGLFFSPDTEYGDLTPGSYRNGGKLDHTLGYYGWGNALTRLNVPFLPVPEFRLTPPVLQRLRLLILPNARAISERTLQTVLAPWVSAGGAIIVTGGDSGSVDGLQARFRPRRSASLVDLARRAATKRRGSYVEANLGMDFYLSAGRTDADLNPIRSILGQLTRQIGLGPTLTLDGVGKVVANMHTARSGGRVFVDFLNEDLDLDNTTSTASLSPTTGGSVTVRLPQSRTGGQPTIHWYDADSAAPVVVSAHVDGTMLRIPLPSFRVYGSLVID